MTNEKPRGLPQSMSISRCQVRCNGVLLWVGSSFVILLSWSFSLTLVDGNGDWAWLLDRLGSDIWPTSKLPSLESESFEWLADGALWRSSLPPVPPDLINLNSRLALCCTFPHMPGLLCSCFAWQLRIELFNFLASVLPFGGNHADYLSWHSAWISHLHAEPSLVRGLVAGHEGALAWVNVCCEDSP